MELPNSVDDCESGQKMTDTVTRLMGLADEFMIQEREGTNGYEARQALHDELVRLFTPLSDEQIRACAPYGMQHMTDGVIRELARAVEKAHGIGGEA